MIFLDASVLLAAEDLDDPNHTAAVALPRTGALGTLELAAYEVTNVAEWAEPRVPAGAPAPAGVSHDGGPRFGGARPRSSRAMTIVAELQAPWGRIE